jgi:predicted dehydrogenase/acetyltransferase-like isoleucine patch superfamily enzyme
LVRNFAALGALAAVADADPAVARAQAAQHGAADLSPAAAIASPDIDAIVLATPAEMHATMTLQALEAGKHVFVEKPIALTLVDADRSIALAEQRGKVLMVGHLLQYHPAFLRLGEIVRAGEIGRLQYVYSNRLNLGKIRREENVLWSFAPHDISMILNLAGELPVSVQATGSYHLHSSIADVTVTNLAFANGLNAHVFVSWLHPVKEQKLIVAGDAGMLVFDDTLDWHSKLRLFRHRVAWKNGAPVPVKAVGEPIELAADEPLRLECTHFLDCVRSGARPRTDGREARGVLAVLDAADRSMRERRPIDIGAQPRQAEPQRPYFVHDSSYVDARVTIGAGTRIWHFSHVLSDTTIGRDCVIGQNVMIGPHVAIGDDCKIQNNVSIYKGVTLEEGVFCGPSCVFTNVLTPRSQIERKDEFLPTRVRRAATIGANATIVCGVELGEYCLVAAGAVVTKDVPAFALVAGVPARRIGWVSHAGDRLGPDLVCPREGRRYREIDERTLVEIVEPQRAAARA